MPDTREVAEAAWSFFTEAPIECTDLDAGRFERLFAEVYARDIEWDLRGLGWPGRDTYHGRAEVRDFFADWFGTSSGSRLRFTVPRSPEAAPRR